MSLRCWRWSGDGELLCRWRWWLEDSREAGNPLWLRRPGSWWVIILESSILESRHDRVKRKAVSLARVHQGRWKNIPENKEKEISSTQAFEKGPLNEGSRNTLKRWPMVRHTQSSSQLPGADGSITLAATRFTGKAEVRYWRREGWPSKGAPGRERTLPSTHMAKALGFLQTSCSTTGLSHYNS